MNNLTGDTRQDTEDKRRRRRRIRRERERGRKKERGSKKGVRVSKVEEVVVVNTLLDVNRGISKTKVGPHSPGEIYTDAVLWG